MSRCQVLRCLDLSHRLSHLKQYAWNSESCATMNTLKSCWPPNCLSIASSFQTCDKATKQKVCSTSNLMAQLQVPGAIPQYCPDVLRLESTVASTMISAYLLSMLPLGHCAVDTQLTMTAKFWSSISFVFVDNVLVFPLWHIQVLRKPHNGIALFPVDLSTENSFSLQVC